jgi:hypothetical protein
MVPEVCLTTRVPGVAATNRDVTVVAGQSEDRLRTVFFHAASVDNGSVPSESLIGNQKITVLLAINCIYFAPFYGTSIFHCGAINSLRAKCGSERSGRIRPTVSKRG